MNKRKRDDDALYKITRPKAIERDTVKCAPMCVLCRVRPSDHVHHIIYRSQLGTSVLTNLACLCWRCHDKAHGIGGNAKEIREILLKRVKGATLEYEKSKEN